MVLWGYVWNFGTTANKGSIENIGNIRDTGKTGKIGGIGEILNLRKFLAA